MLLTILGCSGSVPGPNRAASGYLLEADGHRLVLDLGNGTLAVLQTHCDPFAVDAVLFSHLHADHCADFTALTVWRRHHPDPPVDPRLHRLAVYAPADAPARFVAAYAADERERREEDLSDVFDFRVVTEGTFEIGPFEVTALRVPHPCEAYAYRLTSGGRTLTFTGDTGPCPNLVGLAEGSDVLLSEATWTHSERNPPDLHLSGLDAGRLARDARVGRLLLTHIAPVIDPLAVLSEAESVYPGAIEVVEQGAVHRV